ncbi:carboxypeptidase-like regulatory domain-containing protein [Catenuloplanes indicus]|uniref:Carboxypeptidase regulatory-like domain-containing protein n=1 Tax=Catenuloplanes indicus TaxID=137267 RepID=A0AAE3W5N9_9ACTN|nr:carboxypeptidase-like regulatory domain-containing protein [Catenuloplanes indicus]MDQ0370343.1 hypothetical protein [Catenuloplanes indicus]
MRVPRPMTLVLLATVPLLLGLALIVADGDRPSSDTGPAASPAGPPAVGTVTGLVTDAGGAPVAGVGVQVSSLDDPPLPIPETGVITGADGRYEWRLRAGRYEFSAATGTTRAALPATVLPGGTVTLDLPLT